MRTHNIIIVGLLIVTIVAGAPGAKADNRIRHTEFSIAGSMQAFVSQGSSSFIMNMPLRIGAFISRDVEIEAEGIVTIMEGCASTEIGHIASLNGSYNIPASEKLLPFILIGIGFSNSAPIGNVCADNIYDDVTLRVLNAGFGWKFLLTRRAGLRIEYRMQKFSGQKDYTYGDFYSGVYSSYIRKYDFTLHSLFLGVSLFF
jgi:hypothetical protein